MRPFFFYSAAGSNRLTDRQRHAEAKESVFLLRNFTSGAKADAR